MAICNPCVFRSEKRCLPSFFILTADLAVFGIAGVNPFVMTGAAGSDSSSIVTTSVVVEVTSESRVL